MPYATEEQYNELKEEISEVKQLVYDVKDNHLKGICQRITSLETKFELACTRFETNQKWVMGLAIGIFISVIAGVVVGIIL